jgi:hypothetical protein
MNDHEESILLPSTGITPDSDFLSSSMVVHLRFF